MIINTIKRVALFAVTAALLTGCAAGPSASQPPTANSNPAQPVPILSRAQGSSVSLAQPTVSLITSKAQLAKLNIKPGTTGKLNVNFARNDVILLALGKVPSTGYWARITGVQRVGHKLYVQGLANKPAPNQKIARHPTYPYSIVMIPKTGANDLASDIESVVGQPLPRHRAMPRHPAMPHHRAMPHHLTAPHHSAAPHHSR